MLFADWVHESLLLFYSLFCIFQIMMSKIDIDDMIYTPYSCVDCGRVFQTREELEDHEWFSRLDFDKPFRKDCILLLK
jgi:hypothetical protein